MASERVGNVIRTARRAGTETIYFGGAFISLDSMIAHNWERAAVAAVASIGAKTFLEVGKRVRKSRKTDK